MSTQTLKYVAIHRRRPKTETKLIIWEPISHETADAAHSMQMTPYDNFKTAPPARTTTQ